MRFRDFRRIDRRPGDGTNVPRRVHIRMVASSAKTCSCVGRSCVCKVSFIPIIIGGLVQYVNP